MEEGGERSEPGEAQPKASRADMVSRASVSEPRERAG